jgi:hypothetical protein
MRIEVRMNRNATSQCDGIGKAKLSNPNDRKMNKDIPIPIANGSRRLS